MNEHLRMFLRIFCIMGLIGFGVGTVLAVSAPANPALAIGFGAVTVAMAVGLFAIRPREQW